MEKRNSIMNSKRGQVTILIIVALILVIGIVLTFFIVSEVRTRFSKAENPQEYVAKCARDSIERANEMLIENNGYSNKSENYILYQGEKAPYLCSASEFYKPCINQEPMFIEHIRQEIRDSTYSDVEKCFLSLEKNLRAAGYDVKADENLEYEIKFEQGNIIAEMTKTIALEKAEEKKSLQKFEASLQSPLYNLARTAMTIVNFESTLCEFNEINWMMNHPDINIYRFVTGDGSKVYTLTDRASKKNINFAVKTCVFPAGI